MAKSKDPLLEALREGRSYTWTVPEGGALASMRAAIRHGQTLTMSPVVNPREIQEGDMVFLRWHKGYLFHMVGQIQGNRFLIVNSLGKVNGWVSGSDILGRVSKVVEPEPRPPVPEMLEELSACYHRLIDQEKPAEDDVRRLFSVAEDMGWYAGRIGAGRWGRMPRSNKWSFEQLLWRLTRQARDAATNSPANSVWASIDSGKEHVGLAAEILALLEPSDSA